jgi:Spy/CpxP family protein refolding chaperone
MKLVFAVLMLFMSLLAFAQEPPFPPMPPMPAPDGGDVFYFQRGVGPMPGTFGMRVNTPPGNWWKNSEVAQQLQLTDQQRQQLEHAFVEHRMKLVDLHADVEKEEIKLQSLMDADQPAESQVMAQMDRLLAARANLEKEFTAMTLNFRRIVTPEQWRKLQTLPEHGHRVMIMKGQGNGLGPVTRPQQ